MSQPNHEDAADIYVPGAWRCPLCGFVLQTATLFVRDGAVGHTLADVTRMSGESCPNEGTPMIRVTWQERANEHFAWGSQLMQEVLDATGADSLPAALAAMKARPSPPPTPDVERLKALIGSSLLPLGSVRRRIIAVRKEHPSSVKLAAAQEKLDQVINVFEALVVGDTPTPGGE